MGTFAHLAGLEDASKNKNIAGRAWEARKENRAARAEAEAQAAAAREKAEAEDEKRRAEMLKEMAAQEAAEMKEGRVVHRGGHSATRAIPVFHRSVPKVPVIALMPKDRHPLRKAARLMVDRDPALAQNSAWMKQARAADKLFAEVKNAYG